MYKIIGLMVVLTIGVIGKIEAQESIIDEINYSQLEEFIRLAKENYPRKKIFEAQEASAKSQVSAAQLSYLEPLSAAYFYRPNNRIAIDAVNPYLVNGFQFGASLNLGTFFQKPSQIKQAKKQHEIAMLENEEYERTLENEVKSRYYDYIQLQNELKLRVQDMQDAKTGLSDMQYKYERGEVEFEGYNEARTSFSASTSAKLIAEVNFLKAKDALEEVVGVKLDK